MGLYDVVSGPRVSAPARDEERGRCAFGIISGGEACGRPCAATRLPDWPGCAVRRARLKRQSGCPTVTLLPSSARSTARRSGGISCRGAACAARRGSLSNTPVTILLSSARSTARPEGRRSRCSYARVIGPRARDVIAACRPLATTGVTATPLHTPKGGLPTPRCRAAHHRDRRRLWCARHRERRRIARSSPREEAATGARPRERRRGPRGAKRGETAAPCPPVAR